MFATRPLFHAVRITLFHRTNCGLCHQAKSVLSNVWDKRHFDYTEVDLTKSEQWRNLYDFDIPVIHIAKTGAPEEQVSAAGEAIKLMHRFTEEQVETKMDQAEKS